MSLADEVRTVRQRVVARLNELEPLVREYEELLVLADELGITPPESGRVRDNGPEVTGVAEPPAAGIATSGATVPAGTAAPGATLAAGIATGGATVAAGIGGPAEAGSGNDRPRADRPAGSQSRASRRGSPARSGAGRRRRGRAAGAPDAADPDRDALLLETLRVNPGATTAELASLLGVPATSLYRPVRDLTSSGAIVKRGRGLYAAA